MTAAPLRWVVFALASVALMGGMFSLLRLVAGRHAEADDLTPVTRIEFTRLRRDSAVATRREVKPALELPAQAPTTPALAAVGSTSGTGATVAKLAAEPGRFLGAGVAVALPKVVARGGGFDRDAMPLVRIEPEYPVRAAERGIEGWVLVRFTITAAGTVKDEVVVDAEPKRVFDEAALRAVGRWKYNPRIEEGVAIERRGVEVVVRFKLEQER